MCYQVVKLKHKPDVCVTESIYLFDLCRILLIVVYAAMAWAKQCREDAQQSGLSAAALTA